MYRKNTTDMHIQDALINVHEKGILDVATQFTYMCGVLPRQNFEGMQILIINGLVIIL